MLSSMITLTTRNTGYPDFKYDPDIYFDCQISPDGSKVAVSQWMQAYILGITSGSSVDITDLMVVRCVTWFPDSKRIAYFRSWQCGHKLCDNCYDLVVQRLATSQITTIYRWYRGSFVYPKVLVTPDGSRVITHDDSGTNSFWTWDVSDL